MDNEDRKGGLIDKVKAVLEFARIEHTLFALPFAFMGVVLAADGLPSISLLFWIFAGLVFGRAASLMINDYVDEPIDAVNPRTDDRPLPSGRLSHPEAWILIAASSLLLFFCAYQINFTAFVLSPAILVTAVVYPYIKRYSWISHLVLGLNGSYAPIGGWIAVRAGGDPVRYLEGFNYYPAVILGAALVFWYAGFDIIYSLQDLDFDREMDLHSIPVVFGRESALKISAVFHAVMLVFLAWLYLWMTGVGMESWIFGVSVLVSAALLGYEHVIAEENTGMAFFTVNAVVSVVVFLGVCGAVFL
ncbi:MAG: UbiA-like polyprenyltransferase [Halobacteria archaeon]